jgi:hypothetical protein
VWHVTAGKFADDESPQVAATTGEVHFFAADGKPTREFKPGLHATLVESWRRPGDNKDALLVAGGTTPEMALIALPGKVEWSETLPARQQQAAIARTRPWLAISLGDGSVRVVDLQTGKAFAQVGGHGGNADVAWLEGGDTQPLLVATGNRSIVAYNVSVPPAK